ncbi:hypothetical protein VTO42DRAFT_6760 [Malbranchea cinnamomea]
MPLDGVKHIILILSGKGGVGKSSVTLQLALALTLQGRSVGILDVDLTGPSIPRLVGQEDAKITQAPGGWMPVSVYPASQQQSQSSSGPGSTPGEDNSSSARGGASRGSLRCMSLGFLLRDRGDAVIWRGPKKTAMVRQFLTDVLWGETDYLLIDTPPGTSDEHIALAEQLLLFQQQQPQGSGRSSARPRLAGAVVVTTPQAISTADVRKEINFCAKTRIPVLGVIENMSGYTCPCCGEVSNVFSRGGGQVMAEEMGVRFLGAVPIDVGFGEMVEGYRRDVTGVQEDDINVCAQELNGNASGQSDLLVDRYRKCWSLPIFEGFSKTLIELTESTGR